MADKLSLLLLHTDVVLKHVAPFFMAHVWLTMLFLPTLQYLACFCVMSDSFCHVAQWTFSSKLQFIWKHNEICPTQVQLSTYTWITVGRVFLLFLFDPVILTLLDKVTMCKSLSLNSGKKMILVSVFFSCESGGQIHPFCSISSYLPFQLGLLLLCYCTIKNQLEMAGGHWGTHLGCWALQPVVPG